MKRQLVPMMVVVLLVLSAFTAVSVTTAPRATAATATKVYINNFQYVSVNTQVVITMWAQAAGTTGPNLWGTFHVWHKVLSTGATINDGYYKTTLYPLQGMQPKFELKASFTKPGQYVYYASFTPSSTTYAPSTSSANLWVGATKEVFSYTPSTIYVNARATLNFKIQDRATGKYINGKLTISHIQPDGSTKSDGVFTTTTPSGGQPQVVLTPTFTTAGKYTYKAIYTPDTTHMASAYTRTITVLPPKQRTILTITTAKIVSSGTGSGTDTFTTIVGKLTDSSGHPIANAPIYVGWWDETFNEWVYYHDAVKKSPSPTRSDGPAATTGSTGVFTVSHEAMLVSTYVPMPSYKIEAWYDGNAIYLSSTAPQKTLN